MNYRKVIIDFLLDRQAGNCAIFEQPFSEIATTEIDHVHPRSKGGEDSIRNFQLLHHICNVRKHARTIAEALATTPQERRRIPSVVERAIDCCRMPVEEIVI